VRVDASAELAVTKFGHHLPRCRCGRYDCRDRTNIVAGVRLFVEHLHGANPHPRSTAPLLLEPPLLKSFGDWMRKQRGTTEATLCNYARPIRALIERFGDAPSNLNARGLREFVLQQSRSTGWAAAKRCTTALRMFLRFLIAEGRCRAALLGAIPTLAHWHLSSMPRYLPPEDIERLIASCDVSSPVGLRDRAILLLLARLGLRAGDIVELRLQDIDWKNAWISVCGKGRQQTRLPLSREVGRAIVAYLQQGRPPAGTDVLFLRTRAPFRALRSHRRFYNAQALFDELYASLADRSTMRLLKALSRMRPIVIDELGYLTLKPEQVNAFFRLMDQRYARVSTIITTNLEYDAWYDLFGNKHLVDALLDRLRHHCITIRIDGPSLREPAAIDAESVNASSPGAGPSIKRRRTTV
jgi:site-specific recombinase XerC